MRSVALLLFFMAVGSFQLPWVACELESVHLDLGGASKCGCEHEHPPERGDHEAVDWPAVPSHPVVAIPVATIASASFLVQVLPAPDGIFAAVHARAVAPPAAAGLRTPVLLL